MLPDPKKIDFNYLAQRLARNGYVPNPQGRLNTAVQLPNPELRTEAGVPVEWDYRTAQVNPNGETLPKGALGWTPHGDAYYGGNSGFANWFNGFTSKWSAPVNDEARQQGQDKLSQANRRMQDAGASGVLLFDILKIPEIGGAALQGIQGLGDVLQNLGGNEETKNPNIATYAGRAVNLGVSGLMAVAQEPAEEFEQIRGGLAEAADRAGFAPSDTTQQLRQTQELIDETAGRESTGNLVDDATTWVAGRLQSWFVPFLYSIDVKGIERDFAYGTIATLFSPDGLKNFSEGYEAGRILYSTFRDPALKEEYLRRWRNGENAYLLAEELQNPMAEMAGEILADPLNFVGLVTKPWAAARRIAGATNDMVKAVDEVADVFRGMDDIDDLSRLERFRRLTDASIEASRRTAQGIAHKAEAMHIAAGTPQGRAEYFATAISEWFGSVASNIIQKGKQNWADDALDFARGMIQRASDDPAEVAEGIAALDKLRGNIPNDILFSQYSYDTGVMMRNAMKDGDGVVDLAGFARSLSNEPTELIGAFSKKVQDATAEMFPSLQKRIEAVAAIQSGDAARIAKVPENLAEWAKAGGRVGAQGQAIARMENLANSRGIGAINNFFSSVYMGMSPGYYVRNVITNTFHALVDGGLGVFFDKKGIINPERAKAGVKSLLGVDYDIGAVSKGIGQVGGAPGVSTEAKSLWERITRHYLEKGNKAEQEMSALLAYKSVRDTMGSAFTALRRATEAELKTAGVDTDVLFRLLRDNNYNVNQAVDTYRAANQSGMLDRLRTFEYLSDDHVKMLDEASKLDDYKAAMSASLDEAGSLTRAEQVDALKNAHRQFFQEHVDDWIDAMPEDVGRVGRNMLDDGLADMGNFGETADTINDLAAKQKTANFVATDAMVGTQGSAVQAAEDIARRLGVDVDSIRNSRPEWQGLKSAMEQANQSWKEWRDVYVERIYKEMRDTTGNANWADYWRKLEIPGRPPENLSKAQLIKYWWEGYYFPRWRTYWAAQRETIFHNASQYLDEIRKAANNPQVLDGTLKARADEALKIARDWDMAYVVDEAGHGVSWLIGAERSDNLLAVRKLGILNGIATTTSEGKNLDKLLLQVINRNLPEGATRFDKLFEVPYEVAAEAIQSRAARRGLSFQDLLGAKPSAIDNAQAVTPLKRAIQYADDGMAPSELQVMLQSRPALQQAWNEIERLMDGMAELRPMASNFQADEALTRWAATAGEGMDKARVIAPRVAMEFRNFALIDYADRHNFDVALGLIYPFQFWHGRTIKNWIKRMVTNPEVVAAYAKYKDMMAEIHADLPDWWKYNINSNELLGLNMENPLYFNLEATLNPVQGLTGVDFDNPHRRANWMAALLDDLGKFGPSTWTPLSILMALSLQAQGEEEAAAYWMPRLIPQTQTLQSAIGAVEQGLNVGPLQVPGLGRGALDVLDPLTQDPLLSLFGSGVDPYTEKRALRALAAMQQEGLIDQDTLMDVAISKKGEIWEQALDRAINERAPGQLSSFFLGVGFKGRTANDLMIDEFDREYRTLWATRENYSSDEFAQLMADVKLKYPFADALLIGRKGSAQRDAALAYAVLGKLPPGSSSLLREAGLDERLRSKFYDSKGDWAQWSQSDRDRFMAAIIDMQAVLKTPDSATRAEWAQVKQLYSQMMQAIPQATQDKMFHFWSLEDQGARDAYLAANPEVEPAMTQRSRTIAGTPLLAAYYGGLSAVENYYKGEMFRRIEAQLGEDVWQRMDSDKKLRAQYARLKDHYLKQIDEAVLRIGQLLPEAKGVQFREVEQPTTFQQDLMQTQAPVVIDWPQAMDDLGETALRAILGALRQSEPLSSTARDKLQEAADNQGVSYYDLLFQLREQYGY